MEGQEEKEDEEKRKKRQSDITRLDGTLGNVLYHRHGVESGFLNRTFIYSGGTPSLEDTSFIRNLRTRFYVALGDLLNVLILGL
jgi:hypothetical protein